MTPKLVQCLCPSRHCILALAFRDIPDDTAVELLQSQVSAALGSTGFNPYCGLCGASADKWIYEVGVLKEKDWVKAVTQLVAGELAQRRTAALLKSAGLPAPIGSEN
jgi:hypothetical protein